MIQDEKSFLNLRSVIFFSCEGSDSKHFRLCGPLSQLPSPVIVAQKQSGTTHKCVGVAVFQQAVIYRNSQIWPSDWGLLTLLSIILTFSLKTIEERVYSSINGDARDFGFYLFVCFKHHASSSTSYDT